MKSLSVFNPRNDFVTVDPFDLLTSVFDDNFLYRDAPRTPSVDIREEKEKYLIEVELPGLSEKDVELSLKDRVLTLSTVKKEEQEEKSQKTWLKRERREFRFSRAFSLPEDADEEAVSASFKDGLLTVELGKRPEKAPKQITVKAA
jgi:HSP20 family protein